MHDTSSAVNLQLGIGHERLLEVARTRELMVGQTYPYLAPPLIFGPWVPIAYHLGSVSYKISCSQDGDTLITGEVKYFKFNSIEVVETLLCPGEVTIRSAEVGANILVRFKGTPTGTRVEVTIVP